MTGPRVVRPAELPRQRGSQTARVSPRPDGTPAAPRPPHAARRDPASTRRRGDVVRLAVAVVSLLVFVALAGAAAAAWLGF